jgi:hypothetical protein
MLMIRASALVTREPIPLVAVATEAEARAWVVERRREWEARRGGGGS